MSIGACDAPSRAIRRRTVSAAVWSLIAPNTSTVREANAFSSRNELRASATGAAGAGDSMCI